MKRLRLRSAPLLLVAALAGLLGGGAQPVAAGDSFLFGIDVSHWQGKPRWAVVKSAGVRFVIAKASNANTGRDSEYVRNRNQCRKRGIPFTAYHHAKPDLGVGDAIAEADNFVAAAGLNGNNLLPVLEMKTAGVLSVDQAVDWAKAWLGRVEERLGVKSMLYVSATFFADHLGDTTWFADNGYRLWVRDWENDMPTVPGGDWGGHGWTMWQDGKAAVAGISGKVDTNLYDGTSLAALRIKNNL